MKVGIIGAMDVEVELLKKHLQENGELERIQLGALEYFAGRLGEHEVIISQCKVGMVNAAVAAQIFFSAPNRLPRAARVPSRIERSTTVPRFSGTGSDLYASPASLRSSVLLM